MFDKKIKKNGGFSLPELLAAVAILVIMTAGLMPAALHAYQNAVDAANAQALLTETVNALRSELSTAWDVKVSNDGKTITYRSAATGSQSKISLNGNVIELQQYTELPEAGAWYTGKKEDAPSAQPLVAAAMKTQTGQGKAPMVAIFESAAYDKNTGCVTITGLEVRRAESASPIVKIDSLVIHTLGGEKA